MAGSKWDYVWIQSIVRQRIAEQEQEFCEKYSKASDEELFAYLRRCAGELGGTPYLNDILGASLFKKRFSTNWDRVLALAGWNNVNKEDKQN